MPGYSGTPLPKKLGIKPGFRVSLTDAPPEVCSELSAALAECERVDGGQPITVFDPASRGAVAYRELAKEVSNGAPQRTR